MVKLDISTNNYPTHNCSSNRHSIPPTGPPANSDQLRAPATTATPRVNILGPVTVTGKLHPYPTSALMSTELITFLALHPWDTNELFDQALWPHARVTSAQRCCAMNRARNWLGTDPSGHPYVPLVHDLGYRLHPDITVDWHQFTDWTGPNPQQATTENLTKALTLVQGQPLTGTNPLRYAWADLDRQNIIASLADTATELATRSLAARHPRIANWASAVGVTVEPSNEHLWQLRLQAALISTDPEQHLRVAAQAHQTLRPLGPLEPATRKLLRQAT